MTKRAAWSIPAVLVVAVVVIAAMIHHLGWWTLLWGPLLLLLLGGAAVVSGTLSPAPFPLGPVDDDREVAEAVETPDQIPRHTIENVPLPSAKVDYLFLFSATVGRRGGGRGEHANEEALAADLLLRRARELTRAYDPADHGLVGHRLAAALGRPEHDPGSGLEVWAENVTINLPEEDEQRVRRLSAIRKDQEIREQERGAELDQRRYFGDDVFTTPGRALVWWLARNAERIGDADTIHQAVELVEPLTRLTRVAGREDDPDEGAMPAPVSGLSWSAEDLPPSDLLAPGRSAEDEVDALIAAVPPEERESFVDRFATLLREYGHKETADRIRREHGVPDLTGDVLPGFDADQGRNEGAAPRHTDDGNDEDGDPRVGRPAPFW
ncbi:hypothetical protein ACQEU5_03705 [Marinactinospora thermotolerans]|uniref:Uncharacterized protein n=1 Tax=Marinactinospora thermotolerans DSM 45154 TaxID=1122192 RepID=A0A1T4TCB4_9ACTN|nr:hypothetical protein [Marinactinospora thermotolerans]SKA37971.1 hypothetical protein SAMN02745673_04767 [Marinactinospora thermotolerans DSM 45154]